MLIDLTLEVTPQMVQNGPDKGNAALTGHIGTHFDVMDSVFPLEYTKRRGIVFDVSHIRDRDIEIADIDMPQVEQDMFVAFCTAFIEEEPYGTPVYFSTHPQLSHELIDALLEKKISIIALDCSGVRRAPEHIPKDRQCAQQGVFVVENLINLKEILRTGSTFTAHAYPMHFSGMTGLPCRVVAEV